MLEEMAALYRRVTGMSIVEPAHMELAEPSISQAIDRCVAQGASSVVVSLFFLSPGRHSTSDIPRLVTEAMARHPGLSCKVSEALGLDQRLAELLHARVLEALHGER